MDRDDDELNAEINVTPLVDVMLVLLVIFMISTPLMLNGINLNLPKTKKINNINLKKTQIIISIDQSLDLFIDERKVLDSELVGVTKSLMKEERTKAVFLRADESVPYGVVAHAIAKLKGSGVDSISLITETMKK